MRVNERNQGQEYNIKIWPPHPFSRMLRRNEVLLKTVVVEDDRVVDPSAWQALVQINAGQEMRLTRQVVSTRTFTLEESSQETLKADLSLSNRALASLMSTLEHALTAVSMTAFSVTQTEVRTTEQRFRLP